MTSDESEVALVGRVESADIQLVLTRTTATSDRRIEDWIASNLDLEAETRADNHWNQLIANLPAFGGGQARGEVRAATTSVAGRMVAVSRRVPPRIHDRQDRRPGSGAAGSHPGDGVRPDGPHRGGESSAHPQLRGRSSGWEAGSSASWRMPTAAVPRPMAASSSSAGSIPSLPRSSRSSAWPARSTSSRRGDGHRQPVASQIDPAAAPGRYPARPGNAGRASANLRRCTRRRKKPRSRTLPSYSRSTASRISGTASQAQGPPGRLRQGGRAPHSRRLARPLV